jgi:hypothetical protein
LLSKYRPRFQIWGKCDAPANLAVCAKTLKEEEPLQAKKMSIERDSMEHRSTPKVLHSTCAQLIAMSFIPERNSMEHRSTPGRKWNEAHSLPHNTCICSGQRAWR